MNLTILISSFILTEAYTIYIRRRFGTQKSISASAQLITDKQGRSPLFLLWVLLLAFPVAYVANNPFCWVGACILPIIGGFTMYNPNFGKNQKTIHLIAVIISIVLFQTGIIIMDYRLGHTICLIITPLSYFLIIQPKNFIWWSEKIVIWQIYICVLCLQQ